MSPKYWTELLALVRARVRAPAERTTVIGIVGAPGCGKSTLAERLLRDLGLPHSLRVSLDDFYLTPEQRRTRGLPWRGPPGTHDLALLAGLLAQLAARSPQIDVPVFDRDHERRLPCRTVPGPLSLCIIEGWFVGARCPGYEQLADALELLIYLDMDLTHARAARLAREAALRNSGCGGMSETDIVRFWDEALAPHFASVLLPLRTRCDVRLALSADHEITGLTLVR